MPVQTVLEAVGKQNWNKRISMSNNITLTYFIGYYFDNAFFVRTKNGPRAALFFQSKKR